MIQLPPKGEKVAKLAAAASQPPIAAAAAVLDAEDDEVTLMASSIVELMRDARETRACVMDFVLIDKDVDLPHHLLLINKQYDKQIKLHKEQEAKKKKENTSYEEQPQGQGSPFVRIYVGAVHKAIEVLMTPDVARQLDNEEMMLLALKEEQKRLNGLDSPKKAELGVRVCKIAEARDRNMAKFNLCVDHTVRVVNPNLQSQFFDFKVQDIIFRLMESLGGERRTLPAPPSKKERKMRAMVNTRCAKATKAKKG